MALTGKVNIVRYENGTVSRVEDIVANEYAFTIFLNGEELVTLLCTPSALDYLTIGFLISESFIKSMKHIESLRIDGDKGIAEVETANKSPLAKQFFGKRTMTTGCGKGTTFYSAVDALSCKRVTGELTIRAGCIVELMRDFNKRSELFINTGGVHSAALADNNGIVAFHEDIGRHNALDKVVGEAAAKGICLKDKLIATSGRISSEMLIKAAKREIPIAISRSAPTDLAVQLGEQLGITVIGFVRGSKMNIYSNPNRIMT